MPASDVQLVREVLARELQTINEYERAAAQASSAEVRAFLLHLAEEEKEHVAEAMQLVRRLDAGQEARFAADTSAAHYSAAAAPAAAPSHEPLLTPEQAMAQFSAATPLGAAPLHPRPPNGFTVGPLRKPPT